MTPSPVRVIALIEDPGVIRRILEHLGLWAPLATERSPPLAPASWPRHANLPLTYQFPISPELPYGKDPLETARGWEPRLPCSGVWRRLPSNLPLISAWIAVFTMGEEASMNTRLNMRIRRALSHWLPVHGLSPAESRAD